LDPLEKPIAWVVDIDGTLALTAHRDPYDWRSADRDTPNIAVLTAVQALAVYPGISAIIAVSGRHEVSRGLTVRWLKEHRVPFNELLMRPDGDFRPDDTLKEEIFRRNIEPRYRVMAVIDDRARVVEMWRRLGLVCFQVADGSF
jgi:hypothetical protein